MGEKEADGDVAFAALVVGEVGGDLIVEPDASLFDELHDRRSGGDDFGERGGVEDGVDGHRFDGGDEGLGAVDAAMDDLALVPDEADGTGHFAGGDGIVDHALEVGRPREPLLCREESRECDPNEPKLFH